jgi:hypothetical protein
MNKKIAAIIGASAVSVLLFVCLLVLLLGRGCTPQSAQPNTSGTRETTASQSTTLNQGTQAQTGEPTGTEDTEGGFGVIGTGTMPTTQTEGTSGQESTTKPGETTESTQKPTTDTTEETETPTTVPETTLSNQEQSDVPQLNYQQYMAMSNDEQQKLFDDYFADDALAFASWFKRIKQEYDDENPSIIVTGPIDIGDYINP